MTFLPTRWTVTVHEHSYGPPNRHNERADIYTDREAKVYGWAPPSADREPFEQGRRIIVADLDLYAPADFTLGSNDEVTIPLGAAAGRYQVEGDIEDYNFGPFGFTPGIRASLRRAEDRG